MSTPTSPDQRATARQLADTGLSHRAIGRELGIHHSTVARILRTTSEPDRATSEPDRATSEPQTAPPHEPDRATSAPPPPTSGAPRAPRLIHDLPPWLIQDLNILIDARTGALPAPVARAIHTAAEARRATWHATWRANDERARHDNAAAQ